MAASGTDASGPALRSRTRLVAAAAATFGVLSIAVIAGLTSSSAGGQPVVFLSRVSSAITDYATRAGSAVWWGYAFALGAVAAFNPCGFALLPAYLGLYLNDQNEQENTRARPWRSLRVAGVVAVTFTALFGVAGMLFSMGFALVSSALGRFLPWAGLGIGVVLVVVAGLPLAGGQLPFALPHRLADRVGRRANRHGTRGYVAFGLAYGLASLGCTLPLFLSLLGIANAAGGPWTSVVSFALYGVGMASVLGVLAIAAGFLRAELLAHVRGVTRFIPVLSGGLLLLSGAYVVYYWLSAGRLLLR